MAKASVYFTLDKTADKHVAKEIKQELAGIPGVLSVAVGDGKDTVSVDFDNTGTSAQRIEKMLCGMGLDVRLQSEKTHVM